MGRIDRGTDRNRSGRGPISSTRQRGHSNLRCKRELEQMPSQPTCVPPSRHAEAPCWCRWTAAAPTTACRGRPSSANSARWHPSCSLSCACFRGAPPATAGGTPLAAAGMFLRAKGASKGTPRSRTFRARTARCAPTGGSGATPRQQPRLFFGRPLRCHTAVPRASRLGHDRARCRSPVWHRIQPGHDSGDRCRSRPSSAWDRGTGR